MAGQKNSKIKNVCMLSTHGYFDPVPQLGRTDTGGQIMYVLQLAKALTKFKIRVDIYTRWFDPSKRQIESFPDCPDVRIIRIPAGPWEFISKEEIYDVLPELVGNMIQFIREKNLNYDLFHGHYVDAGIVALEMGKAFKKQTFFTSHSLGAWKRENICGDPEEIDKKYKFSHRISEELRIFSSVTGQTVTSTVEKEKLEQLYGFTSENITVIPPGVDVHTFHPLQHDERKIKINLPDRYIFCLGRLGSSKGRDLLLKAFDIVRKEIPDIYLVIGGGSPRPGPRELKVLDDMNKIVEERNMEDRVNIVGYVPDELVVSYYRQAELFVLPSVFEPFGMTAVEAMACGTPVIASKFAGIKDGISHGKNGLLIDPKNIEEFADAMILLLKDQRLARSIGKEGYKTIHRYFSWEAIAKRHIAFYEKFMSV